MVTALHFADENTLSLFLTDLLCVDMDQEREDDILTSFPPFSPLSRQLIGMIAAEMLWALPRGKPLCSVLPVSLTPHNIPHAE